MRCDYSLNGVGIAIGLLFSMWFGWYAYQAMNPPLRHATTRNNLTKIILTANSSVPAKAIDISH